MNMADYKQREEIIRKEWFPNHKPIFTALSRSDHYSAMPYVYLLQWSQDGTSTYLCRYILHGSTLMVYGDIGEAVYRWNTQEPITWEFIAGCDLSYFAGKCCASEVGRDYKDWSEEKAKRRIKELLEENPGAKKPFEHSRGVDRLSSRLNWHQWLSADGFDCFPDFYFELGSIGEVISLRCQAHLTGLKMAVAQLAANTQPK